MAIELVDLNRTIEFIPASEKDKERPTKFNIRPATFRDTFTINKLFKIKNEKGDYEVSDTSAWFDYLTGRIASIENINNGGKLVDVERRPEKVREILDKLPLNIGTELFQFVSTSSFMNEEQAKN